MRILLTTDTIGGVWTFTQELASGLVARGHAVSLLALGRPASASQQAWCDGMMAGHGPLFEATCHPIPLEWMQDNHSAHDQGALAVLAAVERFRPDLLHSSQFCFGALATLIPRLVTAHSDVLSWVRACRPGGLDVSPWLATYVELVESGLRSADAVAAPTSWMLRSLRDHYPELPVSQTVIANGRTLPGSTAEVSRKLQAVSVGRLWDEGKNVRLLADVHSPWPLLAAGDQEMEVSAGPQTMGGVQVLPKLEAGDLMALFRESSAYICTSVYEPFGLAPLEAALCGCALLLHDIAPLRELWGEAALYFRDARELSELLQRLDQSPNKLKDAQQSAHHRALSFSASRMVEGYLDLYQGLLHEVENGDQELARDAA